MEFAIFGLTLAALVVAVVAVIFAAKARQAGPPEGLTELGQMAAKLADAQAMLAGRLTQLAESRPVWPARARRASGRSAWGCVAPFAGPAHSHPATWQKCPRGDTLHTHTAGGSLLSRRLEVCERSRNRWVVDVGGRLAAITVQHAMP